MKKLFMLFVVIILFAGINVCRADVGEIIPVLADVKKSIDATFATINKDLKAAAGKLSSVDLKGDAARKILSSLCQARPYVEDCSIIDSNGIKVTVEPDAYRKYEGQDRKALPSVMMLLKTKKPVMSDVYHAAEGIHAITIAYPIFSDKGEFRGAVRMLIRYEVFLTPLAADRPCKVWIMQKNGLIVYDADPDEIGRNIFSDSMFEPFKDLVSLARTVALTKNGFGSYDFFTDGLHDTTLVQKIVAWDTAGLYGTEWRIIAMEITKKIQPPAKEK